MQKEQFDQEKYASLKRRVEALQSRVELDIGPEQEQAKRLLVKLEEKLRTYEATHEIPKQTTTADYNTTSDFDFWEWYWDEPKKEEPTQKEHSSWNPNPNFKWHVHFEEDENYHEDTRTEEEMIRDLGILYGIFGTTYKTTLNYHVYKIRFKKQTSKDGAFYRVYSDIYEDDIRICKDVIIGFWPFRFGDDRCGDMQFACMSRDAVRKYNNGCSMLYTKLLEGLMNIWNQYFDDQKLFPMLPGRTEAEHGALKVQMSKEERNAIIERTENDIDSGKMQHFKCMASRLVIMAYNPYNVLSKFLEEAGVVYKVEPTGVYIWNSNEKEFGKLVGYEYDRPTNRYTLYLL